MFQIVGKEKFEQWDLDQLVTCDCLKEGDAVVFSGYGKAYETTAFAQDGKVVADVPNFLLQKAGSFRVDLGWGLDAHMDCRTTFTVEAKEKPEDYVCTCNIKQRNSTAPGGSGGGATSWDDLGTAGYREDTVLYADDLEVDGDMGMALVAAPFNLVPGKEYQVTFKTNSGVSTAAYKCVAETIYGDGIETGVAIGNTSVAGGTIESEAPFVIVAGSEAFKSQTGLSGMIMPLDGGTYINYCIIDGPVAIVNPIPERYLPEKLQSFGTVFFYAGPEEEADETGCYLYNSADTTKAENRVTKEELLAVIHSGRAICLCSTGSNGDLFYFANITFAPNRLGGCMSATFRIGDLEIVCFTAEHP